MRRSVFSRPFYVAAGFGMYLIGASNLRHGYRTGVSSCVRALDSWRFAVLLGALSSATPAADAAKVRIGRKPAQSPRPQWTPPRRSAPRPEARRPNQGPYAALGHPVPVPTSTDIRHPNELNGCSNVGGGRDWDWVTQRSVRTLVGPRASGHRRRSAMAASIVAWEIELFAADAGLGCIGRRRSRR